MALQDIRFLGKKKAGWKERLFRGKDGPRGSTEEIKTKATE